MNASQQRQQQQRIRMARALAYALPRLPRAKAELEADYHLWLSELMPKHFRSAGPEQFAPHHEQFFDWGWSIQRDVLPNPPACLWIVNRGGNKSTSAAGLAVALGAMERRKFGLVITRTETQGDTHIGRANSMLLASKVGEIYPGMTRPSIRKVGNREVKGAWNRTMLTTESRWTLQNFSIEAAQRGVGIEEYRPDFIWITDIDSEKDGPGRVDGFLNALSASILGTASPDCVVIFDQNLIHRDSVLNRILTRKTDVLSNRLPIGPIPAVRQPQYKRRSNQWFVTKGTPTWKGMGLATCEAIVNRVGMQSWEREYQQNITLSYPDAVYPSWDEVFHVITESEFAAYFERYGISCHQPGKDGRPGKFRIPENGKIVQAQDWGNNFEHPCANRWAWRPAEGMPAKVLRDVFFYREMCWPRFPAVEDDDRRHPSAMSVGAAIQDAEGPWESRRVQWRLASHERPEIVRGYLVDLPLTGRPKLIFRGIDTSAAREGILHMQNFLAIDYTKRHPFRVHPQGHPEAGQPLQGKPRVYCLVADGQGELYFDDDTGKEMVMPAVDERGQARTRFEYPNYRKPDTVQGAEKKDPPKIDDDIIDCDRAIAGDLFPGIQAMSYEERIEAAIPPEYRKENVDRADTVQTQGRYYAVHGAKRRIPVPSEGAFADVKKKYRR